MTKKTLKQYLYIKREIKDLEKRIKNLEKKSDIVSDTVMSSEGFPYTQHAVGISGVNEKKYTLLERYNIRLKVFKTKLEKLTVEVEEFIQTVDDSELRQILRYRYHDNYSWVKIMHLMDYESEDKARKKCERFLEKIA